MKVLQIILFIVFFMALKLQAETKSYSYSYNGLLNKELMELHRIHQNINLIIPISSKGKTKDQINSDEITSKKSATKRKKTLPTTTLNNQIRRKRKQGHTQ